MNSRSSNYPVAYRSDVFVLRPANARAEPRRLRLTCAVGSSAMLGGTVATLTLRNGSPDGRDTRTVAPV